MLLTHARTRTRTRSQLQPKPSVSKLHLPPPLPNRQPISPRPPQQLRKQHEPSLLLRFIFAQHQHQHQHRKHAHRSPLRSAGDQIRRTPDSWSRSYRIVLLSHRKSRRHHLPRKPLGCSCAKQSHREIQPRVLVLGLLDWMGKMRVNMICHPSLLILKHHPVHLSNGRQSPRRTSIQLLACKRKLWWSKQALLGWRISMMMLMIHLPRHRMHLAPYIGYVQPQHRTVQHRSNYHHHHH